MDSYLAPGLVFLQNLQPWTGTGKFSLESVATVLSYLGEPQNQIPAIHVAGTNGKGSVCASINSILRANGNSVGMTISPHLISINERIVINDQEITNLTLSNYALELSTICIKTNVELSFFEAITTIFFWYSRDLKLDWNVVEVGLGGRLDATNLILRPVVACIVTIDLDHEDMLGNTLSLIAKEKAGIIKSGCKVVCGEVKAEPKEVIKSISKSLDVPLYNFDDDFKARELRPNLCLYEDNLGNRYEYAKSLNGKHQLINSAVALKATELIGIGEENRIKGISNVSWPGRLEKFKCRNTEVIFDCAHNPAGISSLVGYLESNQIKSLPICFGVLSTKRWKEMIDSLAPFSSCWYILAPDSEKAVNPETIVQYIKTSHKNNVTYCNNYDLFIEAQIKSNVHSQILITGSIYLLGKLRNLIVN